MGAAGSLDGEATARSRTIIDYRGYALREHGVNSTPRGSLRRPSKQGYWYDSRVKVTVDVDAELYRALKVEAARTDRSVRDALREAIDLWLTRQEDREDRASAEAALIEYQRDGGVAAADFFRHLAAEARATYGSDDQPSEE